MTTVYTYGGKVLKVDGRVAVSENCCCQDCEICCSDNVPRFATMTISGVLPRDPEDCVDCPDWNAAWELSLTSGDYGGVGNECAWQMNDGPCGPDFVRLRIVTCQDGTQNYNITFEFGDDVQFTCGEMVNPIDCETFWDHTRTFTFATGSDVKCRWDLATITIDFHN